MSRQILFSKVDILPKGNPCGGYSAVYTGVLGLECHCDLVDFSHYPRSYIGINYTSSTQQILQLSKDRLHYMPLVVFSSQHTVLKTFCDTVQNVQWSTDKVLQQTLAQAEQLHLNVAPMHTLPTLQDIDTVEVSVLHLQHSYVQHTSNIGFSTVVCMREPWVHTT